MNFTEYLNYIYSKLDCSQAELCNASTLSAPVISRYLSGGREPAANSSQLEALAKGIHEIAISKQLNSIELEYENLLFEFNQTILKKETVYKAFVVSFGNIIDQFNINMRDLASALNFDVSYLYRVKSGERHPVDLKHFSELISEYIANNKNSSYDIEIAAKLLNCSKETLLNCNEYTNKIYLYLTESVYDNEIPQMDDFLNKMEEFDLEEYIKVIHFDELKVPNIPFHLPSSKYYYGVENMRKAELDFLKATVLGKSVEPVTMCSFMPMQEMADDMDFGKKWMFGIAMMIKKGLHLNVIHNLDRPMHELMLGFEAWIPIYMTGQVSPYHITNYDNKIFHQINYCSGSAALMGECIDGFYSEGRYFVTNNKNEISYFRNKTDALLKNAKPLMDIYTIEDRERFNSFLKKSISVKNDRRIIASSLPDFTIPTTIISDHLIGLENNDRESILEYVNNSRLFYDELIEDNTLTYDIWEPTKEEYDKNPITLNFPIIFSNFEVTLSYDEYQEHLAETKKYASSKPNLRLNHVDYIAFNNIKITIVYGKYFIISKAKSPNIHFVIYHKKMLEGMENFYVAYRED